VSSALVIVGVPAEKRTAALLAAAARGGFRARCVPWLDALAAPARVTAGMAGDDVLRVESPGGDDATWHALAARGGETRRFAAGEWRPGRAWYRGLEQALAGLDAAAAGVRVTHPGAQVLAMTDKLACQRRLVAAGVPVPELLPEVADAGSLRAAMQRLGRRAVYVKPRWGSSGAGVLAFRSDGRRELLVSTASLEAGRLHNHKRLQRHVDRAVIDALLDAVLGDGAIVQRWIPKAGHAGGPLDLRVLVLGDRVAQAVGRVGRGPITNLHLDAARAPVAEALARFGPSTLEAVHDVSRRAAACFPGHHGVGVDVLVDPAGRPFVVECNAWGDYLPRLLVDGLDSHELYLRDVLGAPS
jgi:glutathione synthase/RimK-type ligase-like ATP-grasp enzyme